MSIMKIFNRIRDIPLDPVNHCNVYKTVGCAHVDGMLCDMRTCEITVRVSVKPQSVVEVNHD